MVNADPCDRHRRGTSGTVLQPRRDARLRAGDTAYLVGPYRELLDTLRKGQSGWQPDSGEVVTSREQT